ISAALARNGFAVLAYDSRGHGDSPAAPFSAGLFEQRDVLGAVDYLRAGAIPYPELGRPRAIGALGISGGDAAALFAAARELAIQAVVSDDGFATVMPIMEQLVRNENSLYMPFVPGALLADRLIYGIDFTQARPVDVVARIAPRPVFFIHGAEDTYIPPSHFYQLSAAARAAPGAQVETWLEPKAHHARDYRAAPDEYTARVTAFFAKALGPDRTQA
ncbi:MAG TPA: alpha/beta hydrolase, partial [Ktedonobacterales bacterium]|nr:alpha/beta hydrolase [Ktedonobacterales bacterium]